MHACVWYFSNSGKTFFLLYKCINLNTVLSRSDAHPWYNNLLASDLTPFDNVYRVHHLASSIRPVINGRKVCDHHEEICLGIVVAMCRNSLTDRSVIKQAGYHYVVINDNPWSKVGWLLIRCDVDCRSYLNTPDPSMTLNSRVAQLWYWPLLHVVWPPTTTVHLAL